MSSFRKKVSVGCLTIAAVVLLAFLSLSPNNYTLYFANYLIRLGHQNNVRLAFEEPELSWTGFKGKEVEIFFAKPPVLIKLENFSFLPRWLTLLQLAPTGEFVSEGYGGLVGAIIESQLGKNEQKIIGRIKDASLDKHPFFSSMGISGLIGLDIKLLKLSSSHLEEAQLEISVTNGRKAYLTSLPIRLSGLAISLKIPEFKDLNLSGSIHILPNSIKYKQIELTSSLGSITGDGIILLNSGTSPTTIESNMTITVSEEASAFFRSNYPLSFISQGALSDDAKSFALKISGSFNAPRFKFTRLS